MRILKVAAPLISLFVLSGCVSPEQQLARQEKYNRGIQTIPVCDGEKDCAAKWDMAQLWVVRNAGYKIQTSSNVLIETYNAVQGNRITVQVTKEPIGSGKYKIIAEIGCGRAIYDGCSPDVLDAKLDFNQTVSAATP